MASLRSLRPDLEPVAKAFVGLLERSGYNVTITSVRRDRATQARLYRNYIAGRSRYPAAAPGRSPHECGIAWDMVLDPPDYQTPGEFWERLGFRWGGRFDDEIHFDFLPTGFVPDVSRSICDQLQL